jgi:hypothetical protein
LLYQRNPCWPFSARVKKLLKLGFQLTDFAVIHRDLLHDLCVLQLGFQDFLLIALPHAIRRSAPSRFSNWSLRSKVDSACCMYARRK